MKKSIAFIGAFFMGALAFAQVSKTETINKEASRKVLDSDLKKLPPNTDEDEVKAKTSNDAYKMTANKNDFIKVTNQEANRIKWSPTEKGKKSSPESENANFLKVTDSKSENAHYKMTLKTGNMNSKSEIQSKPAYKMTLEKADMDATAKNAKASDPYLKISSASKE